MKLLPTYILIFSICKIKNLPEFISSWLCLVVGSTCMLTPQIIQLKRACQLPCTALLRSLKDSVEVFLKLVEFLVDVQARCRLHLGLEFVQEGISLGHIGHPGFVVGDVWVLQRVKRHLPVNLVGADLGVH